MSDIRQASLEPGSGERVPGFLAQAGPFAILAFGALWLHRRFDQLPARLPIHWNWRGEPDGFVNRSAAGAALPLLLGLGICAMMLAMQIGLRRSTPRGAMRAPVIKLVLAGEYLAALLCCGALATTVSAGRFLWPMLALAFAGVLALLGYTAAIARSVPREPLRNPSAWRAGVFYVDRDDPALFVPKRSGLGYTFNFGNPWSLVLTGALLVVPLAIALFAFLSGR